MSCAGSCDGSIVVSPPRGTGAYAFSWTPVPPNGDGSNGAFSLCPGIWSVSVPTPMAVTTYSWTITQPDSIAIGITIADNGMLRRLCRQRDHRGAGGVPPYGIVGPTPRRGPGHGHHLPGGLCAGVHTITVTDSIGCVAQANAFVDEAPAIDAGLVVVGETCNGPCDGTATASDRRHRWLHVPLATQPSHRPGTAQVAGLCVGNGRSPSRTVLVVTPRWLHDRPYQPVHRRRSLTP